MANSKDDKLVESKFTFSKFGNDLSNDCNCSLLKFLFPLNDKDFNVVFPLKVIILLASAELSTFITSLSENNKLYLLAKSKFETFPNFFINAFSLLVHTSVPKFKLLQSDASILFGDEFIKIADISDSWVIESNLIYFNVEISFNWLIFVKFGLFDKASQFNFFKFCNPLMFCNKFVLNLNFVTFVNSSIPSVVVKLQFANIKFSTLSFVSFVKLLKYFNELNSEWLLLIISCPAHA